ncbi:ral-GDS-related protein-like [Octodon degus]|uniref:Ral-GDS-related protein-like n=1 Tax=Octodon degus TaxID=10160 RepID=A0A6P6D5H2_OCTDE|nr:ral-GDS-related protein-like [Octodon degus]
MASIRIQRKQKGTEQLAPTVRETYPQFDDVVNFVFTTCIGDHSMKAEDRARVVEHWIKVAKACLKLRNFSSMHAIISALQSTPVHWMSMTWKEVSRTSLKTFHKLCAKATAENRNLLMKVNGG